MTLVSIACLVCGLLETAGRVAVPRLSSYERRIESEYRAAIATPARPDSILLVGNSLLGVGVDIDRLRSLLGPAVDLRRVLIEDTAYYDWYFGAKRLFSDGVRCKRFVVVLSARQLISTTVHGDYFARRLMRGRDLLEVGSLVGTSRDRMVSMAFGHVSRFWALRTGIRQFVLAKAVPGGAQIADTLVVSGAPNLSAESVREAAAPRLAALHRVARPYGVEVIVVIPPSQGNREAVDAVESAGLDAGVRVIVPIRPGELADRFFSDGFHLNASGAQRFTERLADALGRASDRPL